ncbi:hypothetical protein ACIBEA_43240, partial [Streptomyces sp. NPDC051555]|uniref:hypothetical protein n=1 Tax=Streptomyces sp. NPDC051555 TaxID=3365657 RepID=UPI0037970EFF
LDITVRHFPFRAGTGPDRSNHPLLTQPGVHPLLGISVPVTLALFATIYGWLLLPGHGITASAGGRLHLVDPLLLAVGIATTDGTFDYLLHGYWARQAVLLEMLMLLTIAGTTAFAVARQILRSLQAPRGEPQ